MTITPTRALISALALASLACAPRRVDTTTSTGASTAAATPAAAPAGDMAGMAGMAGMSGMTHYNATLAAVGSSTTHGTAMIHSMNGKQTVELQLSGASAGATLPWHIHSGSCADGMTPIVGNPSFYSPLSVGSDGTVSVMADIPVVLAAGQRYHVNVHASPTEMGTIVACGDLAS